MKHKRGVSLQIEARVPQFSERMDTGFSFFQEKKRASTYMSCQRKVKPNFGWNRKLNLQNYHYSRKHLKNIENLIEEHYHEIISAWERHFSG